MKNIMHSMFDEGEIEHGVVESMLKNVVKEDYPSLITAYYDAAVEMFKNQDVRGLYLLTELIYNTKDFQICITWFTDPDFSEEYKYNEELRLYLVAYIRTDDVVNTIKEGLRMWMDQLVIQKHISDADFSRWTHTVLDLEEKNNGDVYERNIINNFMRTEYFITNNTPHKHIKSKYQEYKDVINNQIKKDP